MAAKTKHIILGFFSLILLLGSLFLSSQAGNREELARVKFGLPLAFIEQDFSEFNSFFPVWINFDYKNWNTVKFNVLNFLGSFLIIYVGLEILIYLLEILNGWVREKIFRKKDDQGGGGSNIK